MRSATGLVLRMGWLLSVVLLVAGCNDDAGGLPDPDPVARDTVAADALPAVVTIAMNSKHTRYGASGQRRIGDPRRLQVSILDRFSIGSMTKAMTATLAGILVQDNLIRWDARLYDVLPELASVGHADYNDVTLRDLLTHSSGLPPILTVEEFAAIPPLSGTLPEQRIGLLHWAVAIVPSIRPGAEFEYSNSGYIAAAAMMERVTNQAYEQLIQQRLFAPLDITPRFEFPAARSDTDQPWPHMRDGATNTWVALDPRSDELIFPAVANPAGGISLRPYELVAYVRMHLQALRGKAGLPISPATAQVLHTEVSELQSIGWVETFDNKWRPISFTAGSDEYSFYGMIAIAPDRDRAAVVLTNGYDATTEDKLSAALTKLLD